MMKRAFAFLFVLFVVPSSARAADATEKLLDATRVGNVLRLQLTKPDEKAVVSYEIDAQRGGILHDSDTFATEGAVDITYANFNPLLISYSSEQTSFVDSAQKAIDDFLPGLIATSKLVIPVPPEKTTGSERDALRTTDDCATQALRVHASVLAEQTRVQSYLTEEQKKEKKLASPGDQASTAFRLALGACVRCTELSKQMALLSGIVNDVEKPEFKQTTLDEWIAGATGRNGVVQTRAKVKAEIEKWQKNRDKAAKVKTDAEALTKELSDAVSARREIDLQLATAVGGFVALEAAKFDRCDIFTAEDLDEVRGMPARAQVVVDRNNTLIEGLNTVLSVLMGAEQKRWRNGDMDVVIDTVEPTPAEGKTVKVTLKTLKFSYDQAKNTISRATGTDATRTFDIRRHRNLITEYGIAGVYNDLRYPKYSVKEEEGVRTVAREFDTSNVNLAATLNFLCSTCIGSGVYPGFQFGVSQAKDYPGLLAGGVLRFGGTTRFAIASGVMITWYKDLNKLTVGGPVESEDKLKTDLKLRRSPAAWYLAVQYTFR
jgi:hypothetical protein